MDKARLLEREQMGDVIRKDSDLLQLSGVHTGVEAFFASLVSLSLLSEQRAANVYTTTSTLRVKTLT
jgi:hypothetical protein